MHANLSARDDDEARQLSGVKYASRLLELFEGDRLVGRLGNPPSGDISVPGEGTSKAATSMYR